MLTMQKIEGSVSQLLKKYNADSALLFCSYARGEATSTSDLDIVVFGGENFKKTNIFSFAEDLSEQTGKQVDAFEISEIDPGTAFYDSVMREGIRIA